MLPYRNGFLLLLLLLLLPFTQNSLKEEKLINLPFLIINIGDDPPKNADKSEINFWVKFSPGPATSQSRTVIGNSVCLSVSCLLVCVCAVLAQLTDMMDTMYIIPKDPPGPHDDACVICFFECFQFWPPGAPPNFFFGSSSAHRQDGPHVYYTKMTGYLDIHELFLFYFLFQTSKLSADGSHL